jgi:UDP-N-acetylmuramyl pentapeptide phosphotransferase/UDP-N-acetylglucosamine-1-phosphate transferase
MIIIFLCFLIILNEIIIKYNLFSDKVELSKHKLFVNNNIPTAGGLYLLIFLSFFYTDINFMNLLCLMLMYLTGLSSDSLKNFSPKIRLLIQILITLLFIINTKTFILDTRIDSINYLFNNYKFASIFFTIFCFIVLINGTNFIDGTNLNAIGYYIIVYSIIYYLSKNFSLKIDFDFNLKIIFFLSTLYLLNFLNKTQLGDSGSYLLSFFSAFYIIEFINNNNQVSPYFAVLILWYPCFENLFSIIRKIYQKKSISEADNYHLHHCIYFFLKIKKFKYLNNITGFIINIINCVSILIGTNFFNSTKYIILIIIFNILIYVIVYNFFIRKNLKKKFF